MSHDQLPPRPVLALCCTGMVTLAFATVAPASSLSAISVDLNLDDAEKGLFLSALYWGFPIAVVISGPAADRFGFRVLLVTGALFQFIGLFLISSASTLASAVWGAVMLGWGGGACGALLTPIVCLTYSDHRARVSNLIHAFYPIGLVLAIGLVLVLMHLGWDWRPILRVLAVLVLPFGLAAAMLRLPTSSYRGPTRLPARRVVRQMGFIVFLLAMLLTGMTEISTTNWLPHFVETQTGSTPATSVVALLLFGLTNALGRLLTSAIVVRWGSRTVFGFGGVLCALSLLMAALPMGTAFTIFWLSVLGFGVAGFWPTILGCAGDRYAQAGASMFSLLTAAGILGGAVGPMAIGLVAETYGLRVAMALLAVAPVTVLCLLLRLSSRHVSASAMS